MPRRQQRNVIDCQALAQHEAGQHTVDAFEPDRVILENEWHMVCRDKSILEAHHDQPPAWRTVLQIESRPQNRDARSLAPHQRARKVKSVLRQEFVQVVPGHAPRNPRKFLAD